MRTLSHLTLLIILTAFLFACESTGGGSYSPDASTPTPEDVSTPTPDIPCAADCAGKQCGDDGCGGTCGNPEGCFTCDDDGQCVGFCTPSCGGKECGTDGCGGSCGDCQTDQSCENGQCSCLPETCTSLGKNCGSVSDGCDSMIDCGQCPSDQSCGEEVANVCGDVETDPDALWCDPAGGSFASCGSDADCNEGLYCDGVNCLLECAVDGDCGPGAFCAASLGFPQCYKPCTDDTDCCPDISGLACHDLSDSYPDMPPICII